MSPTKKFEIAYFKNTTPPTIRFEKFDYSFAAKHFTPKEVIEIAPQLKNAPCFHRDKDKQTVPYKEVTAGGKTFYVLDPLHNCVRLPTLDDRPVKISSKSQLGILSDGEIKKNIKLAEKLSEGIF